MLGPVLETLIGGLVTGGLFSLVALGVVLIFQAFPGFYFPPRAMGLFAALSFVRLSEAMTLLLACSRSVQVTRVGRALRAVADDHQAAQSVGIPLNRIWLMVWAVSGLVALVAGMMWGVKLGVQFSLSLIALKALPVLILGGLTSIPGAIVGGLIVGAGEKVAEVFWGPAFGGAIEDWFAYVLALVFLLFRPQGLFGERIIERV